MLFLIREGNNELRAIRLVEIIWKVIAVILDRCFTASITYHNSLHRFRASFITGNTTLEIKLIHQVADFREALLHTIFLYLHRAYDAFDRSRCLDILKGYGVVPRALHLLRKYWERMKMLERAEGYY